MFFYFLVISEVAFLLILFFSKVTIKLENMHITVEDFGNIKFNKKYKITFQIFFLKLTITNENIKHIKMKGMISKINSSIKKSLSNLSKYKEIFKRLKKIKIEIKYLDTKIVIGTENAMVTSIAIGIISSIISVLLRNKLDIHGKNKYNKNLSELYRYVITPIYSDKNLLKMELDCIFRVKLIHIMYIIYIIIKKDRSVDKNERTSNRGTYGYSYE